MNHVRLLRILFVAAESGSVAGTVLFLTFDRVVNAHPANPSFDLLRCLVLGCVLALPVISLLLLGSNRNLSVVGFLTFVAVVASGALLLQV
jgi:predicted membrane protein